MKTQNSKLIMDRTHISSPTQLVQLYQTRIAKMGMSGRTMFYATEKQHRRKLLQFSSIIKSTLSADDTILDIGCGYGKLLEFLPPCKYVGIDLIPEFVEYARRKYPGVSFLNTDLREYRSAYDWGVLLGVVNGIPNPEELIELAWMNCNKGLLVDFIDVRKLNDTSFGLNVFDTGDCFNHFLTLGAPEICIYDTPNVWTIFVVNKNRKALL